jgi:AraC family transcriptional regulator, regulatory protein of adaptative response / methylated-DNA-[protein]-cysteine methyltransferase
MKQTEVAQLRSNNFENNGPLAARHNEYWKAVEKRDSSYDGQFVFAVRSTGIYCRPSCPSKRAQHRQVLFFSLSRAAEVAGFRACKRCHPEKTTVTNAQMHTIGHSCSWIESHLEDPLNLHALSLAVGMSPYHLQRTFKRFIGISPRQYADALRLRRFKARLKKGDSVTEAMYNAGYGSSSRLYERASSQLGMTPRIYRKGGLGMRIYYNIRSNSMGHVLVAATERGICSVRLGDSAGTLESGFRKEFPAAEIKRDKEVVNGWIDAIVKYLEGRHADLNLPLDIQATTFQWRVWEVLRSIPYGTTRTYSDVARAIGNPKAVRAVARACASNPVALVIPCHRVIREDKSLGGYRWGLQRKERLLKREAGR